MNDDASQPAKPLPAPALRDDTVLDWARAQGAGNLLAGGLDCYLRRRRQRRITIGATAGVLLLAAGFTWRPIRETKSTAPIPARAASATILRPEQRTLPDGSTIDLNAGAEIEVNFDASFRRIVLRKGEAHFQVTKDAQRPFIVTAAGIEVHAVGTAFVVDLGTSAVDVVVTEGRVAVNPTAPAAMDSSGKNTTAAAPPLAALAAGGRIIIERATSGTAGAGAAPQVSALSAAEILARLEWRVPRLKFAAAPLAQVVAMFNEHAVSGRDARLVLASDIPVNLHVSGVLRADDVDSLLRLLGSEFGISGEARAGEIVLRQP